LRIKVRVSIDVIRVGYVQTADVLGRVNVSSRAVRLDVPMSVECAHPCVMIQFVAAHTHTHTHTRGLFSSVISRQARKIFEASGDLV